MTFNDKDREFLRLARKLSRLTGESMSIAVTEALRERLERERFQRATELADRLLSIGKDCAEHLKEPYRSADHGDLLYGE